MDSQVTFLNCPQFLDRSGTTRCGLPAEAARYVISSTDGPLESARITCPRGHHFNGPIESDGAGAVGRGRRISPSADTADLLTN